jgi:glycosyltransferase involved in cell wall biosynthesis
VYVVTRAEPIGGAQVHVRDLARAIRTEGFESAVITGGEGAFTHSLRSTGIHTVVLPDLIAPISLVHDPLALRSIRRSLRTLRPDLVSTHSSKAGVLGRLAARSIGVPVLFTAHGWSFTPGISTLKAAGYRLVERWSAPLADRIITVSEFDRQLALSAGVASEAKLVTIHNGMPDAAASLRADPGRSPPRLVMIARFESQKDHGTLLHALADLKGSEWTLDLIGDGPLMAAAKSLAAELGLGGRVRFLGQRLDVDGLLAEAQLYLLITNWEGLPRSILEAMRAGLPVVATRVGGIGESVADGQTGFLVPRGDAQALRDRIQRLLADPGLRAELGARGRREYESRFTLDRTVAETLAVYRATVARQGLAPSVANRLA